MSRYCVVRITKKDKVKITYLQHGDCDTFWTEDKKVAQASASKMNALFPGKSYQVIEHKQ